jgi:plasmid stability protein
MATLTIRSVPDDVKQTLRVRAAERGLSLEEALRRMLAESASDTQHAASKIDAREIMRRAQDVAADEAENSQVHRYLTHKEISDAISGEFEGL